MHLYMIRWPAMDVIFHLHPEPAATGEFRLPLPTMPAGTYHLYADVVHAIGFPETIVGTVTLSEIGGRPLAGDDAQGNAASIGSSSREAACGYGPRHGDARSRSIRKDRWDGLCAHSSHRHDGNGRFHDGQPAGGYARHGDQQGCAAEHCRLSLRISNFGQIPHLRADEAWGYGRNRRVRCRGRRL
jgi:hypothetical protein